MLEEMLTKIVVFTIIIALLIAAGKIFNYYMLYNFAKAKTQAICTKEQLQKRQEILKKQEGEYLELINYKENVEPYYFYVVDLFRDLMRSGKLNREQILFLEKLIDDSLGDYKKYYQKKKFQNDCHSIYSKLKSCHISVADFERISMYLENFNTKEGVINA